MRVEATLLKIHPEQAMPRQQDAVVPKANLRQPPQVATNGVRVPVDARAALYLCPSRRN